MNIASHHRISSSGTVICLLCPHACNLADGEPGICGSRKNTSGQLILNALNQLSAIATDPMEKKPLYHYYPGSEILSVGGFGCNLSCIFCQNSRISMCKGPDQHRSITLSPGNLVEKCLQGGIKFVAFTYNEPLMMFEYIMAAGPLLRSNGIKTVMVTNGYISQKPMRELCTVIDAFNVDLKAFDDRFYIEVTGGKLAPVIKSLQTIRESGNHMEITFLAVTGLNDNLAIFKDMISFIADEFGTGQVLHISRYFPSHKASAMPTPLETLDKMLSIARDKLQFVYPGTTGDRFDSSTYCPSCSELLLKRDYYSVRNVGMSLNKCRNCAEIIPGAY